MKKILVFLMITVVVIATAFVAAQQRSVHLDNALQSLQYYTSSLDKLIPALQPLDNAINNLNAGITKGDDVDESLLLLGLIYQEQGKYESSKNMFIEYLVRNPEHDWVNVFLGELELRNSNLNQALKYFNKALVNEESARANYGLGIIYREQDLFSDAITAFNEALEIEPSFVEARIALAKEYHRTSQYDLALEEFETSYLYTPRNPEVHFYLWQLYTREGDLEKANHSRELAIQYEPSYANIIENF